MVYDTTWRSTVRDSQEDHWLELLRRGRTIRQIAAAAGLKIRRIHQGLARARERERELMRAEPQVRKIPQEPQLVPLFPVSPFVPGSICPHHGPIRKGSVFCCMVCSQSGKDDHPALQRDPKNDPKPDPKPEPLAGATATLPLTRRKKRQLAFSQKQSA